MKKKTLIHTNPHLRDPERRRKLNEKSVISSSGVEGIKVSTKDIRNITYIKKQIKD